MLPRSLALLLTCAVFAALPACVPHTLNAKGRAAQATVNCENGYDQDHHIHAVTPQCRRNGAMGTP